MFDDIQPPKTGGTPNNLPLGEPEDIFERTEVGSSAPDQEVSPPPTASPNTALDAGILKPKVALSVEQPESAPVFSASPQPVTSQPTAAPQPLPYTIQTPSSPFLAEQQQGGVQELHQVPQEAPFSARKIFVFIAIVLVIALLGFGSFSIYTRYIKKDIGENNFPLENSGTNTDTTDTTDTVFESPVSITSPTTSANTEDSILFGEPADTDSDGIPDADESTYGTNNLNWDTDGDELSDGDEIMIWKTNALIADTDVDGYTDSVEIKNGYNPLGEGKLFEPPTTTLQNVSTTP